MTSDELIDYLTMLSWSALCGIVEVGGSLEKFRQAPHPSPICRRNCLTERMSRATDLPSLWTHEPHIHLEFKPGENVADIDTSATPGFRGAKNDAPELQAERNERFAELQEMLYANSRAGDNRKILLVLQGMDTAGKGGIVKHVVGAGNPQGIRYARFGKPTEEELAHDFLWRISKRCRPRATSGSSTGRTTRTY